jgi:hypothetical protein
VNLHGIGQQIEHNLLQRAPIPAHGCAFRSFCCRSAHRLRSPAAAARRRSHEPPYLDSFFRELITACLDLREIEDVIDHVEQVMAGRVDLCGIVDVLVTNQL